MCRYADPVRITVQVLKKRSRSDPDGPDVSPARFSSIHLCHPDDSLMDHLANVRAKGKVVRRLAKRRDYLPLEEQNRLPTLSFPAPLRPPTLHLPPLGCIDLLLTKYKQEPRLCKITFGALTRAQRGPGDPAELSSWTLVVGKPRTELRQQPPGLRRSPRVHLPSPATCSRPNINVPQGKCTLKMLLCLMGNVSKLSESTFIPR